MSRKPDSGESGRMSQLDGLRTLAVAAVAFSHWAPKSAQLGVPWGTGVQLFFVLSGFLITAILLKNRPADADNTLGMVLRNFYARRFLRIFPLYYGVLFVCLVVGAGSMLASWPWHFGYLSNFYFFRQGPSSAADPMVHFWSLSVEEQFYIVWPLLILTVPRPVLRPMLIGTIVLALVFRISVALSWRYTYLTQYITPSCFDALGIGAYLAYVRQFDGQERLNRLVTRLGVAGAGGVVLFMALARLTHQDGFEITGHTFLVLFYGYVVGRASGGFKGWFGWFLDLAPAQYLGKISYGLYVYHNFVPFVVAALVEGTALSGLIHEPLWVLLIVNSVLTVGISALSWHAYESPLNNLKRHFNYSRSTKTRPS